MNSPEHWMREAIRLSLEKMRAGHGGPFGAVVVRDDKIVASGWNQVTSANDPTAHAEVVAIREACRNLKTFRLDECQIYSSCEPCPMCLAAIYWARLGRLSFAGTRDDAAMAGFDDAFLYRELLADPEKRRIPTFQLLQGEALAAFEEWKSRPNRIMY